ncbi:MAG: hypothetical protein ACFFBJ_10870, partial [Promethearchaeota archaeon]
MKRGTLLVVFVLLILASGTLTSVNYASSSTTSNNFDEPLEATPEAAGVLAANDQLGGVLNPVVLEQRGNRTSAPLHAETDS